MKAFFLPLTEPLGIVWVLMILALGWVLCRRQWRTGFWLATPVLLLFLVGSTPLAEGLVAHAEKPYAVPFVSAPNSQPDAVVVLGGGFRASDYDCHRFALEAGASRIATGIELARHCRGACLVLGGSLPMEGNDCVVAARVQEWVEFLCLPDFTVTNLGICSNTHDESIAFKRLLQTHHWRNILLVTSALHMSRSAALFNKQGIAVSPVACDFRACGTTKLRFSIIPQQDRLDLLKAYMHEKIGMAYYRWKGWA
jgi:uncharacterized SAM-binding protein YcdF (DUF218 family)